MKLCTFEVHTSLGRHRRLGVVLPTGIVDMHAACAWHLARKGESQPYRLASVLVPNNMLAFLQGEVTSMTFAKATIDSLTEEVNAGRKPSGLSDETLLYDPQAVRMKAPLPNPTSMRDFYTFEQHVKTGFQKRNEPMPQEWYEIPVYYKGAHWSILGPDDDVTWPSFTEKFDYELELAIIIGKKGKSIKESEARDYIAGFTVMNDFSARDIQRKEMRVRLGPSKGKDFATSIGPVLVTTDDVGDPYNLSMTARVNGEVWSQGNSGTMYHTWEKMIAFASMDETLYPGDLIGSGTVGTGCGLELDRWVKPGDVIELEIENIGVLRNKVVK
jgi:2-keto-4-pentenoate hydratase/2-oxohepta-3-ene-1,7-dioic acid hydratase in catechol pathway